MDITLKKHQTKSLISVFSMTNQPRIKLALVVPHIFLHRDILPQVIFSPGFLAIQLAESLQNQGVDVTLFSPGPVDTSVSSIQADLSYFESELAGRGDTYINLLKKHPFTFVTLSRQVQSEIISKAYDMANNNEFDIVHIYTNEEDTALPFAKLCIKPVIFTHHDPFNFMVKYKNNFPKYKDLNWLSLSYAQRATMPDDTHWIANIYHGIDADLFTPAKKPADDYIAYLGRIIQPKGLHLAIAAVRKYNLTADKQLKLLIAGKHYSDGEKDRYWQEHIELELGDDIQYVGFIKDATEKNTFLSHAAALVIPSLFDEPFGMVMIEALASGTPIIGLDSGAIPEIINEKNGILIKKQPEELATINGLVDALIRVKMVRRDDCRADFESRFTTEHMTQQHIEAYKMLIK